MTSKKLLKTALMIYGGVMLTKKLSADIYKYRADYKKKHNGTSRILLSGVWKDDCDYIYNRHGTKIGRVEWEEGFH